MRHIKTIAQFDCTSYPTGAHSDPVLRLWDGLTRKHHSSIAFFFPGTVISHFLDFFLSLFFNSRAKSSVCNLSLGFSFAFGVHHTL